MASLVEKDAHEQLRRQGSTVICPICIDELVDAVKLAPCGHQFCAGCASTLLRMNADTQSAPCPICRSPSRFDDVTLAATGENFLRHQLKMRRGSVAAWEVRANFFDVVVLTKAVAFGSPKMARHAHGSDAESPSRFTPDLWAICDSCYFCVHATATNLPAGRYDAFFHIKRIRGFTCQEPVRLALVDGDDAVQERSAALHVPGADAVREGTWKLLRVGGSVDVGEGGRFECTMTADQPQWWKSGLLVDCLVVVPAAAAAAKKRRPKHCAVA